MSIEPLVFKILADADDRGVKAMDRSVGNLDITSKKASTTMRSFVAELAQAKTGADLASAALNAFSKVLGATLLGTAAAIGGKILIDAFQKISENVNRAKDSLASARQEVEKMGLATGLAEGAAQASILNKAAAEAEKAIKEIENSKLQNFIAEVRGAKDELRAMAQEARQAADEVERGGIQREAASREVTKGLSKQDLEIRKVNEEYNDLIEKFSLLEKSALERMAAEAKAGIAGPTAANIDLERARSAKAGVMKRQEEERMELIRRQKEAEMPSLEERLKGGEAVGTLIPTWMAGSEEIAKQAEARGAARAKEIARMFDSKEGGRSQSEIDQRRFEIAKEISRLEMDASTLRINVLDLEKQNIEARRRVVQAEARVAEATLASGGTGRGPGQRPTSAEVGAAKRAEHAARQAEFKFMNEERQRVKDELELRAGNVYSQTGELIKGREISQADVNREFEKMLKDAAVDEARQKYEDAANAREGAGATEQTLRDVRENLRKVLDELKTYAHAI